MINLDTNVLLRWLLMDDAAQGEKVRALLATLTPEKPGFVSLVALTELVGVLDRYYAQSREQVGMRIAAMLNSAELQLERHDVVQAAVQLFRTSKAGFNDCLVSQIGIAEGCVHTVTFDRAASRLPGMRLLR